MEGRDEGGAVGQRWGGAVVVGVGVNMLNSAKITDTSAVHLECFQWALNVSCSPGKVYRAARTEGGLCLIFFVEEIGGLSPFFFLFNRHIYINYPNFSEMHRSTKAGVHISTGATRKANKWLLMCIVSQTEKQMPSTHESTHCFEQVLTAIFIGIKYCS